jgi:hypothetical protein
MARYRYIDDPEALQDTVRNLVTRIHDEADPHEMNEYKRFIKKNVSVFTRAYFTAFLLKELVEGTNGGGGRRDRPPRKRRDTSEQSSRPSEQSSPPSEQSSSADQQTLFVSVGKNRRVFPKDFLALLTELDGIEGEQIGQIKILDSYSFVEVDTDVADRIIEAYNGYEYRGRKLTVNYARNKKS